MADFLFVAVAIASLADAESCICGQLKNKEKPQNDKKLFCFAFVTIVAVVAEVVVVVAVGLVGMAVIVCSSMKKEAEIERFFREEQSTLFIKDNDRDGDNVQYALSV
eukprot:3715522-Ditylum_brightwellii.AAC.1